MHIGIVVPSFLDEYKKGATNRVEKFNRAIESILSQKHKEYTVAIVSDGCSLTEKEYLKNYQHLDNVYLLKILKKQPMFSGIVRQVGVDFLDNQKEVKVICYLDSDDKFGTNHLRSISNQFKTRKYNWIYWNDLHFDVEKKCWYERQAKPIYGDIGTPCIAHKSRIEVKWNPEHGYTADQYFIQNLRLRYPKFTKIKNCQYYLMHCPSRYDL